VTSSIDIASLDSIVDAALFPATGSQVDASFLEPLLHRSLARKKQVMSSAFRNWEVSTSSKVATHAHITHTCRCQKLQDTLAARRQKSNHGSMYEGAPPSNNAYYPSTITILKEPTLGLEARITALGCGTPPRTDSDPHEPDRRGHDLRSSSRGLVNYAKFGAFQLHPFSNRLGYSPEGVPSLPQPPGKV
jgi:hypothetical protein